MNKIDNLRQKAYFQFIIYSSIGGVNVILDFTVINLLMVFFNTYTGAILFFYKIISLFIYSINGYIMNKKFTFQSTTTKKSYFFYMLVLGTAAIANGLILVALTSISVNISPALWANISNLVASIITGTLSFLVTKFFVFKAK
ncbi:GtrA family protein [Clostridium sp. DL1XJH146]